MAINRVIIPPPQSTKDGLKSGSVTIIGDFWQPFCVGKNNGGHKGRPRKTTKMTFAAHGLGSEAVRAADRADIRDTCASSSHFFARAKKCKKSLNIVTLPL